MSYSWSYSAFSTALTCLRKFQYVYIDKLTPEYNSADLAFGSALHLALNACLTGGSGEEVFTTYWQTFKYTDLVYGRYKWTDLETIGLQFVAKFQKYYVKRFKVHTAEVRLFAEYRGIKFEGTMDLLAEFDAVMTLVDFKTTSAKYEPDKAKVSLQLYLYAYLCITSLKVTPAQIMYLPFIKGTGGIQTPVIEIFKEADMYRALDQMVDYLLLAKSPAEDLSPMNYNSCYAYGRKCEFWAACHGKDSEEGSA